jgi:hypothetical protein
MANALFAKGKKKILDADIDLLADDIKCVLVDHSDHNPDTTNDEFLADIDAGGRVGTSGNLSNKATTGGVFDADDVTVSTVTGHEFESIVIYKDTGDAATSPLIAKIDTATGLPCTPNGGDIVISWDSGASKIFAI